ncbi:MAG: K(+)-transporting ATPase subunit C [Acidobacteria bacterium]|nr:K(+)-transporting ATPase subunit C [Acidobacteriota bacterium]
MTALRLTIVMTVLTGLLYPAITTAVAQLFFPRQANGSLVTRDGRVIGSSLIGQQFTRPEYFHPRPSAAGAGYDAAASGGSNLGPTSQELVDRVTKAVAQYKAENPDFHGPVPADAATASASGLDPDITPANAEAQVDRVAAARSIPPAAVRALVRQMMQERGLGVFGEPRVNVLQLNLALDARFGAR